MPAPVNSDAFRNVPAERLFPPGAAAYEELMATYLRHETALNDLSQQHASLHEVVQTQLSEIFDKLECVHEQLSSDHSSLKPAEPSIAPELTGTMPPPGEDVPQHVEELPPPAEEEAEHILDMSRDMALAKAMMKAASDSDLQVESEEQVPEEQPPQFSNQHWLAMRIRSHEFETAMSVLILVNIAIMAISLQWSGFAIAQQLGLRDDDAGWSSVKGLFQFIEVVLNLVYAAEMVLRIWALRIKFFMHIINWTDLLIVAMSLFDMVILQPLGGQVRMNFSALRMMRALRIFRFARIIKLSEHMAEMRVLIRTLMSSVRGIGWSMLLVAGVVAVSGVLMVEISHPYMTDESLDIADRKKLWEWFGTTFRGFYVMFECTFTGGWRDYSKPMLYNLNPLFGFFWIPYVVCINFAVIRVIAALFLKQTMAVAAVDEERVAMQKLKQKEAFATELHKIFSDADTSGDGAISKSEFDEMLHFPQVLQSFEKLDLELDEVVALFTVLSADDGEADYEEFLNAALKMKSSARTIDTIQILHQQLETHRVCGEIHQLHRDLHKNMAKRPARKSIGPAFLSSSP